MKVWLKRNKIVIGYFMIWCILCWIEVNKLKQMSPVYQNIDAFSAFQYIYMNSNLSMMVLFGPLIVITPTLYRLYCDMSGGMLRTYLTRQSYFDFFKKKIVAMLPYTLMISISYLLLFLFCSFAFQFNFDVASTALIDPSFEVVMYKENLPVFMFLVFFIPILCSSFWILIGFMCIRFSKNYFVSLALSYIVVYICNFYETMIVTLFSIPDFHYSFDVLVSIQSSNVEDSIVMILYYFIAIIGAILITWIFYRDKERLVIDSET